VGFAVSHRRHVGNRRLTKTVGAHNFWEYL
jgi:hypothetical protein